MMDAYLKQMDPRSLRLISGLLWLVLAAAVIVYGIKPQYKNYRQGIETRSSLESVTDNRQQLQDAVDQLRAEVEALRNRLDGETENLPPRQFESYLIGRLQGICWNHRVELVGVKPGSASRVLGFEESVFEVEVRGGFHSLYDWLEALGDKLGFMLVKSFQILPLSAADTSGQLKMNVTMVFYRTSQK